MLEITKYNQFLLPTHLFIMTKSIRRSEDRGIFFRIKKEFVPITEVTKNFLIANIY